MPRERYQEAVHFKKRGIDGNVLKKRGGASSFSHGGWRSGYWKRGAKTNIKRGEGNTAVLKFHGGETQRY